MLFFSIFLGGLPAENVVVPRTTGLSRVFACVKNLQGLSVPVSVRFVGLPLVVCPGLLLILGPMQNQWPGRNRAA